VRAWKNKGPVLPEPEVKKGGLKLVELKQESLKKRGVPLQADAVGLQTTHRTNPSHLRPAECGLNGLKGFGKPKTYTAAS
jgi:hypothetical protein